MQYIFIRRCCATVTLSLFLRNRTSVNLFVGDGGKRTCVCCAFIFCDKDEFSKKPKKNNVPTSIYRLVDVIETNMVKA